MKKTILSVSLAISTLSALSWFVLLPNHNAPVTQIEPKESPEGFDEFERLIRTRDGEDKPNYPSNYKMEEFNKAYLYAKRFKSSKAKLDWKERGPGNISGRTRGVVVDISDTSGQTWFVGSVGGGIWKTTNRGGTWQALTENLPNLATVSLNQSPSNPDIFYAGTGEGYSNVDAVRGDGIFKSTDHGNTWQQLTATAGNADFGYVNRMVIDPTDDKVVVAATNTGIFKTADGGLTWKTVYKGTGRIQQIVANPKKFSVMYASENSKGILKSTNKGESWTLTNPTALWTGIRRSEMAIAPSDTARLYVSADSLSNSAGSLVLVSRNSGTDWTKMKDVNGKPAILGTQGWYDNTIAVHPTNADVVFIGGVNLWRVTVNADNTRRASTNGTGYHVDLHNIVFLMNGNTPSGMILANDGGVAYSTGDPWTSWQQNNNKQTTQFYGAAKKPGESVYVGGMQDNGTAVSPEDPGAQTSWIRPLGGDGFEVLWHSSDPTKVIGGSQYNYFSRSLNGGASWALAVSGLANSYNSATGASNGAPFINRLATSVLNPDVVYAVGDQGVWRTNDFGGLWEVKKPGGTWRFNNSATHIEASNVNPKLVWSGGRIDKDGGVVYSLDNGETWQNASGYSEASLGSLTSIYAHPTRDSTAFLTLSISGAPHILRTDDLGKTWKDITGFGTEKTSSNGFPNVATYSVAVMPHNPNIIWAGTEIGLFESTDAGKSWHYADNGLPAVSIWELRIFEDEIVVATHGRGIWSVKMPELLDGQILPPLGVSVIEKFLEPATLSFTLRTIQDSTVIYGNNKRIHKIAQNTVSEAINLPVNATERTTIEIRTYKNNRSFSFFQIFTPTLSFQAPRESYLTTFEDSVNPFMLPCGKKPGIDGWDDYFALAPLDNFTGKAIHSPHPYSLSANATYTCTLAIPIIVEKDRRNSALTFDEIALVQNGSGTTFGQLEFGSYVLVEATKDGKTWIRLGDGYNARAYSDWLSLHTANTAPTQANYKKRTYNLLDKFVAGDKIALRFRMLAGPIDSRGWGWVIDNLEVQKKTFTANETEIPLDFALQPNYPNPFNPITTISYSIGKPIQVQLTVYNLSGQKVATLVNEAQAAGTYTVPFKSDQLASGVYFYKLQAGDFVQTRKMVLMK